MTAPNDPLDLDASLTLPRAMLRACRRAIFKRKATDSAGSTVTGGLLLMKAIILRRLLLRSVLSVDELRVGVLLPPSVGAVIVNATLALARRVAVNLNYSATSEVMNACVQTAGIRHVLTSRKVLDKLDPQLDAEIICLEDLKPSLRLTDKLVGALMAYALPSSWNERLLGLMSTELDDIVTIIFTSGSTGRPKGVMLSHRNLNANILGMERAVRLNSDDTLLGILPFFHAFGYTVTLWGPLTIDIGGAYHFNPLDARQVGKLARSSGATILLSTPTFLRSYLKRVPPEDFEALEIVIVGAEKLPGPLSDAFEERFGIRPVEGYGATELSPLVSVNIPPTRSTTKQVDAREGSIGLPLPGVAARVVNPDSGEPLPTDTDGMLEIAGPNLMRGYFEDERRSAEVIHDGWYVTGDIARIDAEGFIHITGRQSRFSKIGGEMVPHVRVEEEIQRIVAGDDAEDLMAVVTAVPDQRKGERLIVVHLPLPMSPSEACDRLKGLGLPNLWIPTPESFMEVEELPLLGSGKLDLKQLARVAAERFGADDAA